jgi:2-polyprenyl-3-methyl-5-hydroxy-6-metoxy-1,4-benzoquinol methylase
VTESAAEVWERRYQESERRWSGKPNAALVAEIEGLESGSAIDLGCGEGADAIWLAQRGWRVTGIDASPTALGRAAQHATDAGVDVSWVEADLSGWEATARFDLVAASYLHSSAGLPRERVLRAAADAVAPGGSLFIVAHAERPPWWTGGHHDERLLTARETWDALALDAGAWDIVT